MLKNISWDTKDKIKVSLLVLAVMAGKIWYESTSTGLSSLSNILFILAASVAFAVFFLMNLTDKGAMLFSAQGVITVITLVITFGAVISTRYITKETLITLIIASIMLICAKKLYLMPVIIVVGAVTTFNLTGTITDYIGLHSIPAAIGVSCVCLSDEIGQSSVLKKILFAVFELALTVLTVKAFYTNRYIVSLGSLFNQVWDTIVSFVAVVILVALAVYSVMNSKNIIEIFGYVAVAAFGIVCMMMEIGYVLPSAMTMFMMLMAVSKEGSTADIAADEAVSLISKKYKSNKKHK